MNINKIIRTALSVLLVLATLTACGSEDKRPTSSDNPFLNGSKQPWEYTMEEFQAMTEEEQVAFRNSFASLDAFYAWVDQMSSADIKYPWDRTNAKKPFEYTWAEFEALSAEEQMAFQNSFENLEAFDAWLQKAQNKTEEIVLPWENSGKQPADYTWAEFEALSAAQQMLFQQSFESLEAFDAWMQEATGNAETYPWDKAGAKQPKDYTWAEFEALSAEHQMAFQNSFHTQDGFDAWMEKALGTNEQYPWEKAGAKQPKDYSWAEFEALTGEQQMAFQSSFDSQEDFDAWLRKNDPQEAANAIEIPWENGGKQPDQYTWAEFEALSAELQMIFQNSFGSFEAFDAWLHRVNP